VRLAFGTDGVRGVANSELSPELALAIGRAAARILGPGSFLVGRDTRRSGPLMQSAFSAGLASEGIDVIDLGVMPTPGVACIASRRGLPAAVISASHNPFQDNGVKLLGPGGIKLDEETERTIEEELTAVLTGTVGHVRLPQGAGVGAMTADDIAAAEYETALVDTLQGRRLDGLSVVLDCANGAASSYAARVFAAAGAGVTAIADAPDGTNINEGCGSTHPEALAQKVVEQGADAGLAFDGDADRLVAVTPSGQVLDGDQLLAIFAVDLRDRGLLAGETMAITILSNLGLKLAMAEAGIAVHETPVGDRHLSAALETHGWMLGGEQSGHIILRHLFPTGDGMLTGLALLDVIRRRSQDLDTMASSAMTRLPQIMRNVVVADRDHLEKAEGIWEAVAAEEVRLGRRGRVVVRASGTEPLVRVMVEAVDQPVAEAAVARLCAVVEESLNAR
jgi:phosphoglucosamine mutase